MRTQVSEKAGARSYVRKTDSKCTRAGEDACGPSTNGMEIFSIVTIEWPIDVEFTRQTYRSSCNQQLLLVPVHTVERKSSSFQT